MIYYFKKLYHVLDDFFDASGKDHINAYSAQSSFFIIISVFPFIMLIFSIIRFTPVSMDFLLDKSIKIMPDALIPLAEKIINEMYQKSSGTILSFTAVLALWSSSKGVLSIIAGLNNIFKVNEKRNYFVLRAVSALYTILFIMGIILSLTILVYGNALLKFFKLHSPIMYDISIWFSDLKIIYVPLFLTIIFVALYKLIRSTNYTVLNLLPGAIFSAFGWILFSYFYSIYIDNFAGSSYAYGSLTTFVLMMLWVYFCMYILFIGAEINVFLKKRKEKPLKVK